MRYRSVVSLINKDYLIRWHLSQNPPLDGGEVEEEFAEEMIILHQLIPRGRRNVSACSTARQRHVLCSISRYPCPARCTDVAQALVVRRWHVVHRCWHASARLFRGCVRIIRALQIRIRNPATPAEHVRNALHDARLSPTWNIPMIYLNIILYFICQLILNSFYSLVIHNNLLIFRWLSFIMNIL